jgi:predicted Zn-dependent peptidase
MSNISTRTLTGGTVMVHEHIPAARSVAVRIMVPVGIAGDPADRDGESAMLSEYVFRGAGGLDSRQLSDALDREGVDRSVRPGPARTTFGATMLADRFDAGMPLVISMLREPAMPDEALEPVRSLCLQAIESLDDDPQHLVMVRLGERARPAPFSRHGYGDAAAIGAMDAASLRAAWTRRCVPGGSIVAVAGGIEADAAFDRMERWLEGWTGQGEEPAETAPAVRGTVAIEQETAQVHIGLAWDGVPESHPDAMREKLATAILSGGTSGRLFSEVRQKRSLCYSVGASFSAGRERGLVSLYAGTTPERAQETLDVSVAEIRRMAEGFADDEFARAVVGMKSRIVMQGESTPARASALASDQFRIGRPRSLEERLAAVDAVTADDLRRYVANREPGVFTLATIGPRPLTVPGA